jgi:hypothetical protein
MSAVLLLALGVFMTAFGYCVPRLGEELYGVPGVCVGLVVVNALGAWINGMLKESGR